ncbi:hypothetical protein GF385_02325 [Candidatus Dependentiae bacterium]|nr:hypothetical protein [Candidatus Dependentiae bacterium]
MHNKELCFVLKRFLPNKNKLSVLSKNFGKIEIITRPTERTFQLWPGMLLAFNISGKNTRIFFAQNLEILMSPHYDHILKMEWVHSLLEICYYFSPICNPAGDIFNHIYNSFNIHVFKKFFLDELHIIKKIYLIKLLELLGFYPCVDLIVYLGIYQELTSIDIDFVDKDKIKLLKDNLQNVKTFEIKKIDNWIKKSLMHHSHFKLFKTFKF